MAAAVTQTAVGAAQDPAADVARPFDASSVAAVAAGGSGPLPPDSDTLYAGVCPSEFRVEFPSGPQVHGWCLDPVVYVDGSPLPGSGAAARVECTWNAVYCNVYRAAGGGFELRIEGGPPASASDRVFFSAQIADLSELAVLVEFDGSGGWSRGGVRQKHLGAFVLYDAAKSVPGNFEPAFADDNGTMKLDSVGGGYWPFGRVFTYAVPDVDDSAKFATGLIYLEVAHPSTGSSSARATVKGGQGLPAPTDSVSYIPLYQIEGGRMAVDYRSCMSLPMREM